VQTHKLGGPAVYHTMGYQSTWMTNPNCSMEHYSRYEDHYPWHNLPSITEDWETPDPYCKVYWIL